MSKRGHNYSGFWINFEAGEGAGKGTQQKLLVDYLLRRGFVARAGREPGTTLLGERIRKILLDPKTFDIGPEAETLLFLSAGTQFFDKTVRPSLEKGEIFITDRWRYSTMAYQGYGAGVDLDTINTLTKASCNGAYPDLTFLLDIDPETGLSRITGNEFRRRKKDRIESRGSDFHRRVNQGFRDIARQNPERFRVIPYLDRKPDEMQARIREYVEDYIKEQGLEGTLARVKV